MEQVDEPRLSVTVKPSPLYGAQPELILHLYATRTGNVGLYPDEARQVRDALTRCLAEKESHDV